MRVNLIAAAAFGLVQGIVGSEGMQAAYGEQDGDQGAEGLHGR